MQNRLVLSFAAIAALALPNLAHADTVVIAGDLNAPTSNFQNPGTTATYGYTINTTGDGTSVIVSVTAAIGDAQGLDFANLYFESVANDTSMGSNVGFEASATGVTDAFTPGGPNYSIAGLTGFSSVETFTLTSKTITVTIPDSFFLTDPLHMGFELPASGTDVSLHLSQSFGYSVVGGNPPYARPNELGLAEVDASPVPEPAGLTYMALSGFGLLAEAGRRLRGRRNA